MYLLQADTELFPLIVLSPQNSTFEYIQLKRKFALSYPPMNASLASNLSIIQRRLTAQTAQTLRDRINLSRAQSRIQRKETEFKDWVLIAYS